MFIIRFYWYLAYMAFRMAKRTSHSQVENIPMSCCFFNFATVGVLAKYICTNFLQVSFHGSILLLIVALPILIVFLYISIVGNDAAFYTYEIKYEDKWFLKLKDGLVLFAAMFFSICAFVLAAYFFNPKYS